MEVFNVSGARSAATCTIVSALLLVLTLPAMASETDQQSSSLSGLVAQAWHLNPQAAGFDARVAEARAAKDAALELTPEPAALTVGHLTDRQGRNLGKQEWEVELALPLWLPGQRQARDHEADSRINEVAARRTALRLEVAGEVREAWWSLAALRSANALAMRRFETARSLHDVVKNRFKVGELSRIDANLAQGEVLAAEAEVIESQAGLLHAEQSFRQLTGNVAPVSLVEESVATVSDRLDSGASLTLHPQLAAVTAVALSARARVRLADETRRVAPELSIRVVRDRAEYAEPYANNVGVKLKIPFSSGAQVRRDSSLALAEAEQAETEVRRAEIRLQQEIERARRTLVATERQLSMAQERHSLSADNLHLAEKSFTLGESDLATLLRIRASAIEAESVHDRQRIARAASIARLKQSLGIWP